MELNMQLCEEVKTEYIPIISCYNIDKKTEMAETIYEWMKCSPDHLFVQRLGNMWLKSIMRIK